MARTIGTLTIEINADGSQAKNAGDSLASQWGKVGAAMMKTGAAIVGAGVEFAKAWLPVETALLTAQQRTVNFGYSINDLRDIALEVGAGTRHSMQDVADAMAIAAQGGITASDVLNGSLSPAFALADAHGLSLAKATDVLKTAMVTFGLDTEQTTRVADLFTAATQNATISIYDITGAFKNVAGTAATAGVDIGELTGALAVMAEAGYRGGVAGTYLNNMLNELLTPTDGARRSMDELGITLFNAYGEFIGLTPAVRELENAFYGMNEQEKLIALDSIFGVQGMRAAVPLLEAGADALADLTEEFDQYGVAASQAAAFNESAAGQFAIMRAEMADAAALIGQALIPVFQDVVAWLRQLANWASENIETIQRFAPGVLAAGAALFGLGAAIKTVTSALKLLTAAKKLFSFSSAIGSTNLFKTSLLNLKGAGGLGGVKLALTALKGGAGLAGLGLAFRGLQEIINAFSTDSRAEIEAFYDTVSGVMSRTGYSFAQASDYIAAYRAEVQRLAEADSALRDNMELSIAVVERGVDGWERLGFSAEQARDKMIQAATEILTYYPEMAERLPEYWRQIAQAGIDAANAIYDQVPPLHESAIAASIAAWESRMADFAEAGAEIGYNVRTSFGGQIPAFVATAHEMADGGQAAILKLVDKYRAAAAAAGISSVEGFAGQIASYAATGTELSQAGVDAILGLLDAYEAAGGRAGESTDAGLASRMGDIVATMRTIAETSAAVFAGPTGPLFVESGERGGRLTNDGLASTLPLLRGTALMLATQVVATLSGAIAPAFNAGAQVGAAFAAGLRSQIGAVSAAASNLSAVGRVHATPAAARTSDTQFALDGFIDRLVYAIEQVASPGTWAASQVLQNSYVGDFNGLG